ncbi:MAG: leucine-rich repeat domain-containing protein [Saprospiraceae bacterium]|nr:leucine-rich repeat domain-containing protein [Saprospiraceae bacterium]
MNRFLIKYIILIIGIQTQAQNITFDDCSVSPMYPTYDLAPNYPHEDLNEYFKSQLPEHYFKGENSPISVQLLIDKTGKICCKTILNVIKVDGIAFQKAITNIKDWTPAKSHEKEINVSVVAQIHFKEGQFRKIEFLDASNKISKSESKPKGIVSTGIIEDALKNIETLTSFSQYGEGLQQIDPRIGELINLKELYLGKNEFETIPLEIFELEKLEQFHIYNTKLKIIPPEITKLKNLKIFIINDNEIEVIPEELGQMKNLRFIRINGNPLKEGEFERLKR